MYLCTYYNICMYQCPHPRRLVSLCGCSTESTSATLLQKAPLLKTPLLWKMVMESHDILHMQ